MSDEKVMTIPIKAVSALDEVICMLAFMGTAVSACQGTMNDETAQGASEIFFVIETKLKNIQESIKAIAPKVTA